MALPIYSKLPQLLYTASHRRRMELKKHSIVIIIFLMNTKMGWGDHLRKFISSETWIQLYKAYDQDGFVISKIVKAYFNNPMKHRRTNPGLVFKVHPW